jgi:hypothetical protein
VNTWYYYIIIIYRTTTAERGMPFSLTKRSPTPRTGRTMCLLFYFSLLLYTWWPARSRFRPLVYRYLPNNIIITTFSLLWRSLVYHYYYHHLHHHHRHDYYRLQCHLLSQLPPNSENSVDRFLTVHHDNNNMFEERWWWWWRRWRRGRVTRIAIARWPTNL